MLVANHAQLSTASTISKYALLTHLVTCFWTPTALATLVNSGSFISTSKSFTIDKYVLAF